MVSGLSCLSFGLCLGDGGTDREDGFFKCFNSPASETGVGELCCCSECCWGFFLGSLSGILGDVSFFEGV